MITLLFRLYIYNIYYTRLRRLTKKTPRNAECLIVIVSTNYNAILKMHFFTRPSPSIGAWPSSG